MKNSQFRLRLDVPYQLPVHAGYRRTMYCHNMKATGRHSNSTTWKCPATGLIMLRPSFLTEQWYTPLNWKALGEWTYISDYWQEVVRGADPAQAAARHFTTVFPGTGFYETIQIANAIAVAEIASAFPTDRVKWVMKSKFDLARDEGFVWECRAMGDEKHRPRNWFVLSWDNLYIHFSYDGTVRVYTATQGGGWQLFESFEIASAGDLLNQENYFIFLPIPGYGLALYHSHTAQTLDSKVSSASAGVSRSHLIKLPQKIGSDGLPYVHDGGKVSVGLGAVSFAIAHQAGMHLIRYNTSAVAGFLDNIFDPGANYASQPGQKRAIVAQASGSRGTAATITLRNEDNTVDWDPNTHRKGRLRVNLSTSNARYTPFVVGTEVGWYPEFNQRDTTPVKPDSLWRLEFSENDNGTFSGHCTTMMKGEAQRRLVERGDTTFVVERCDDPDAQVPVWVTQGGGIARIDGQVEIVYDHGGCYYIADWDLTGIERLFMECANFKANAFDGMDIATAINTVLAISGFPPIAASDFPAPYAVGSQMYSPFADTLPAMPAGQEWRWGAKVGDQGNEILRTFLLLAQRQNKAYRLRWDWDAQKMVCEAKPRDTAENATWRLTPWSDELSLPRRALYGKVQFGVQPPEANVIQTYGLTETSNQAGQVPSDVIRNLPSLYDKTSVDYLGRVVAAYPLLAPFGASAEDKKAIAYMTRRFAAATFHRRLLPVVKASNFVAGLTPGKRVLIRGEKSDRTRASLFDGQEFWVRRRSVVLDYNGGTGDVIPQVEYALDSVWEEMI